MSQLYSPSRPAVLRGEGTFDPSAIKIACIGSSGTQQAVSGSSAVTNYDARGYMCWLNILSGQRFYYNAWLENNGTTLKGSNKGVSGEFTSQMLLRVKQVIDVGANVCIVQNAENEMSTDSYDNIIRNTQILYDTLLDAGIFVIALGTFQRVTTEWTVGSQARIMKHRVNKWKRDYSMKNRGIIFVDQAKYIIDPDDPDGQPYTNMLYDGIHTSAIGGYTVAKAILEAIDSMFPKLASIGFGADNVYHVDHNPQGNLLPNPTFTGTAGVNGTGSSGSVPTSWRVERSSGSGATVVNSVGLHPDMATNRWTGTFTSGGGATELFILRTNTSTMTTGISADKWYQGELDVEVTGSFTGIKGITLLMQDQSGATLSVRDLYVPPGVGNLPPAWQGRLRTPPLKTIGNSGIRFRLEITIDGTVSPGATFTVSAANPYMAEIESPVTVLNGG